MSYVSSTHRHELHWPDLHRWLSNITCISNIHTWAMSVALKPELHQQHSLYQSWASSVVIRGVMLVVLKWDKLVKHELYLTIATLITSKSDELVPKHELNWHANMRDIGNTQTWAVSVALTDMSYIDSIQPQAKLIIPKSGKLLPKHELSGHWNMSYIGSTRTQATGIILKWDKLGPNHELSWHSNMRDIGNTQTGATSVSLRSELRR